MLGNRSCYYKHPSVFASSIRGGDGGGEGVEDEGEGREREKEGRG